MIFVSAASSWVVRLALFYLAVRRRRMAEEELSPSLLSLLSLIFPLMLSLFLFYPLSISLSLSLFLILSFSLSFSLPPFLFSTKFPKQKYVLLQINTFYRL
jgi:hypothetical protein